MLLDCVDIQNNHCTEADILSKPKGFQHLPTIDEGIDPLHNSQRGIDTFIDVLSVSFNIGPAIPRQASETSQQKRPVCQNQRVTIAQVEHRALTAEQRDQNGRIDFTIECQQYQPDDRKFKRPKVYLPRIDESWQVVPPSMDFLCPLVGYLKSLILRNGMYGIQLFLNPADNTGESMSCKLPVHRSMW